MTSRRFGAAWTSTRTSEDCKTRTGEHNYGGEARGKLHVVVSVMDGKILAGSHREVIYTAPEGMAICKVDLPETTGHLKRMRVSNVLQFIDNCQNGPECDVSKRDEYVYVDPEGLQGHERNAMRGRLKKSVSKLRP